MAIGDVYKKVDGEWSLQGNIRGPAGPAGAIGDLGDVDTTGQSDGQFLQRASGIWTPVTVTAATVGAATSGHTHSGYATDSHDHDADYEDAGAVATHAAAADPHAGYLQESVISGLATPAIVLGTTAAAGSGTTPIRHDSTIVAFDTTAPTAATFGATAATGSVARAARRDHRHAMPADPVTGHESTYAHALIPAAADVVSTTIDSAFTASVSGTWTKPSGIRYLLLEVQGAGGGGGGVPTTGAGEQSAAGGGGGGGYSAKWFGGSDIPSSIDYVARAGGTGGMNTGTSGSAGGDSEAEWNGGASTMIGLGGAGGAGGGVAANARNEGGAGGGWSGVGDVERAGQGGGLGSVIGSQRVPSGFGGGAGDGGGGAAAANDSAGNNGVSLGAGGSGASRAPNSAGRVGGNGQAGYVRFTEYY